MPVTIVPVTDVPESSAQQRKPLPMPNTPLTGLPSMIAVPRRGVAAFLPGRNGHDARFSRAERAARSDSATYA